MAPPSPEFPAYRSEPFDGYFRLTFDEFLQLDFTQRRAWEDQSLKSELLMDDIPACRAGYCEWAAPFGDRLVSVGWAWFSSEDNRIFLAPGGLSSNVMLVTPKHYDMGMQKTSALLQSWLPEVEWQQYVWRTVNTCSSN